jgi:8-oxo-dGTP pyrophosphatase MutT (NUDIX family)
VALGVMTDIVCSGGLFLSKNTQRFLFLLRDQGKTAGSWGIAGGKLEPSDVTPYDGLLREIEEELGSVPTIIKTVPIEWYASRDEAFSYHTYILIVEDEFIPRLNEEHSGYAWCSLNNWPKPLHQGLKSTLTSKTTRIKIETILNVIA